MPHFFAKSLDSLESVANRSGEYFDFILEAINPRDKSALILAQNKSDSAQKILLLKQQKNDKFLVKFNKHFKVQSREAIKNALKDYAKLTNAEIIAHNLNANKAEAQSQYLLDSRGIFGLFDSQNGGESDSIDSRESSELRFKNAPKMVEIGFGSGRHILNLAQNNPNALIIGLEIYRPAILQVLRQIEILGLQNLYLASIDARVLFEVLPRESLSAIFLHFPVPWDKNPQRRVFSEVFLANAIRTLSPQNGRFELITDSKEYFDFAKKLARIYKCKVTINPQNKVVSKYEARWKRLKKDIYKLEIFPQIIENSSLGASFALVENFEEQQTTSLVLSSKFSTNTKSPPQILELDSNKNDSNESKTDSQKFGFLPPKICKKEYFLQIKDKYEFGDGFVIYVVFGAYYAPNSAYIIVRKNSKYYEILGDIIPTKANLSALNELQFLGSYA